MLSDFIINGWGKSRKTTLRDVDLPLPFPFVPPSITQDGIHCTLYYWDTYFTNVGLIADGHVDWARENTDNLLFALNWFGCVPNYTRKDGADFCSQPPLLFLMVRDVYAQTKDDKWLENAVGALELEYKFWMNNRMTPIGLNQYGTNATDKELLLGYYDYVSTRVSLSQNLSDEEKMRVAKNFIAEAESGEDYTPRYSNHNALEYAQIDLNAHLYGLEEFLVDYFKDKNKDKFLYYSAQKDHRKELIEKYCYNEETGVYCDYNFVTGEKNKIVCSACFLPYFYGFARDGGNLENLYEILKCKGGTVACQDTGDTAYQWGYPYVWAPHQFFAYVALKNGGCLELAEELRVNYMTLLSSSYDKTGTLWERYDENGPAAELEYPTQPMLGWTAGTYRYFSLQDKKSPM